MKNKTEEQNNNKMYEQAGKKTEEECLEEQHGTSEIDIQKYPLRKASEDPRWAVWVVWIWLTIALFLLLFIITLFILGFWFD